MPNPIYEAAERRAQELAMPLREFYVAALDAHVATYQNWSISKKLNEIYAKENSTLEPDMIAIQIASMGEDL